MFHDRCALVSPMADTPGFELSEVGEPCANLYYFGNDTLRILCDLLSNDDGKLRRAALTRKSITRLMRNNYA